MAWGGSAIFREMVLHALDQTEAFDLDTNSFKAALFNNSVTPDKDETETGYNEVSGQFLVANEVIDTSGGSDWPTTGRPLVSPDVTTPASGVVMFDAADTASAGATADIANARGTLVYNDTLITPDDPGVSFNDFGSAQSVTNGTFTIVWHANGILRITV